MSMFLSKGTCMNDQKVLHKVLKTRFQEVESHESPQQLIDFVGKATTYLDAAGDKAEVIVRRKFVGGSANDIGFKRNAMGNFDAIISQFDSNKHNEKWLENLSKDYLVEKAKSLMSAQEAELVGDPVTGSDGSITMKFRQSAVYA